MSFNTEINSAQVNEVRVFKRESQVIKKPHLIDAVSGFRIECGMTI